MADCRDIEDRIARGETPSSVSERAHLEECESCRLLVADDGHLGRALGEAPRAELDLAGLRESVNAELDAEVGPVAYLRSRTTFVRAAVTVAVAALVALVVLRVAPRSDLSLYPMPRMALALALLLVPLLVALVVVLRPLQRHALPNALVWGALILGVATPWVLALLPRAHALHPDALGGDGSDRVALALRCLAFGIATGLPVLLALWAFDRGAHAALRRALVAAAAAGLMGNLVLQGHCPITSPSHLALGHATVGLVLLAAYVLGAVRARM